MRGAIVVPIFRGEDAVGALGIGNLHERTFTLEEIDLLVQTGRLIAGAQTPPEPEADAAIDP
jgi:GAF domain-containing protein